MRPNLEKDSKEPDYSLVKETIFVWGSRCFDEKMWKENEMEMVWREDLFNEVTHFSGDLCEVAE